MSRELGRKLKFLPALAISVGGTLGSGIFVTSSKVVAQTGSNEMSVLAWIIGGLIFLPEILLITEIATAYPENGFGYAYFKQAGMKKMAFVYVVLAFFAIQASAITIYALAVITYMGIFIPFLVIDPLITNIAAMLLIVIFTIPHLNSVKGGGNLVLFQTILKVAPFVVIFVLGMMYFNPDAFASGAAQQASGSSGVLALGAGAAATVWAFSGMTSSLYMAGEIENPQKNLKRILLWSCIVIVVIYTLVALTVAGNLTFNDIVNSVSPLTDCLRHIPLVGQYASAFINLTAILVIMGTLSTAIMFQPRMQYQIAKDGEFFQVFGHVSKKETPNYSILIQVGVAILLLGVGNLQSLVDYFTIFYLIMHAIICGMVFVLRKREDYHPYFRCPVAPLMMGIVIATRAVMSYGTLTTSSIATFVVIGGAIGFSLLLYVYWQKIGKKKSKVLNQKAKAVQAASNDEVIPD